MSTVLHAFALVLIVSLICSGLILLWLVVVTEVERYRAMRDGREWRQ